MCRTINFVRKVDEKLNGKLRAPYLDTQLTTDPYTKLTSTYPLGCRNCTGMYHSAETCDVELSKKRNRSSNSKEEGPATKVAATGVVNVS